MLQPSNEKIRIFIGSSLFHRIEEKVLIYSLQKHTRYPLEIYVMNGEDGSVRFPDGTVHTMDQDLRRKLKGYTSFSLARFLIPAWCEFQGKAIYCDSDILCLSDIAELWRFELKGHLAAVSVKDSRCPDYYDRVFLDQLRRANDSFYLTSVMLLDCAALGAWKIRDMINGIVDGEMTYNEVMWMGERFRKCFSTDVTSLPAEWNHLDLFEKNTRLIHFTELQTQPWRFDGHPCQDLWHQYFLEAQSLNCLDKSDVESALIKGPVSEAVGAVYETIVR